MIQPGTTPLNTFTIPLALPLVDIEDLVIVYCQNNNIILKKTKADTEITDDNKINIRLSQEDTLKLENCKPIEIQIKLKKGDLFYASAIIATTTGRLLDREAW